jgi:hypothetical protein
MKNITDESLRLSSYHDVKFVVGMVSQKVNMPQNIMYSCKQPKGIFVFYIINYTFLTSQAFKIIFQNSQRASQQLLITAFIITHRIIWAQNELSLLHQSLTLIPSREADPRITTSFYGWVN